MWEGLVAAGCAVAAAWGVPAGCRRHRRRRRLRALRACAVVTPPARDLRRPFALLAGVAAAVVVGGVAGVVTGLAGAAVLDRLLRRLPSPVDRATARRVRDDLPLAADLLAAALRSGAPVDRAAAAVADALSGPLGARLGEVARALRLGADPAEAWARLGPGSGPDRLARAAARSSASGAALAGALLRLGAELRADRLLAAEEVGRRAGVLVVLPLGLCFLPAFLLAGLVPVVVAVLGDVW